MKRLISNVRMLFVPAFAAHRRELVRRVFLPGLLLLIAPLMRADSGSFTNSGGSGSGGAGIFINSSIVANPAGTLSLTCAETSPANCAGGSINFASSGSTSTITGSFTSGRFAENCYGGGRGGTIKCYWSLTGYFTGTWTVNGVPQAITGVTYQSFPAPGTSGSVSGTTAFNSAYTPFYYSDSGQIHRADDLMGTNQISFNNAALGGLYGAYGIALDSSGRIYVADTYNCRVVRTDDMNGTNAIAYGGTCGSGQGQFYDPQGIAVDSTGKIYIMDTGNSRFVRIDDMNGTNWTTFGTVGSGVNQFLSFTWVTLDSANHIYVADAGNGRIVRIDDMNGTNWTTLSQSQPVNGVTYTLGSPTAVAVDAAGKLYIANDAGSNPEVIRVDNMTGANYTSIYLGVNSGTINAIAVDSGGSVFLSGGGAKVVDGMSAVLYSSGSIGPVGSYYVFGITPIPLPNPRPSALSFTPPALSVSQNVGSTSSGQPVTVYNFGGSPLSITNISVSGAGFAQTNTCLGTLAAGSTCTISVTFTPPGAGTYNGSLSITDNSGNLGPSQTVSLSGTGTSAAATVSPTSLNFGSQMVGATSTAKTVVLTDSGTGPMKVSTITITGPFSQANNCTSLAAGASCNISVTFSPTALGSASGTLSITDDAGIQTVPVSGTGAGPLNLSPNSLEFNSVIVGTTSPAQTVTATNNGTASITINGIAISGPGFAISSNTCGSSLGVGSNCTVSVTFAPTVTGDAGGALTFTDSALGSPQSVSLQGTASGAVSISPTSLSFGTVASGATSSSKTVTLTNHESVAVNFASIAASANFNVASNTCAASLAAGGSCTIGVTFSPNAVGTFTGTLTFTDNAPNSPQVVGLSGTGGGTPVTVSPTSLSFGTVRIGTTTSAKTVTLTNHQNVSLNFTSIAASAPYAISANTCGASIGALATCTVGVKFTPNVKGTINGALTFTDNAGNSPQNVTLTGSGK